MTNAYLAQRTVAVTLFLLLTSALAVQVARAQGANQDGHGRSIVGTWFIAVPFGPSDQLGAFYTYDLSGTVTAMVTNMFGGLPFVEGLANLYSTDRGIWRRVPGGFEAMTFRMVFDPSTGNIFRIVRIRTRFHFAGDRNHLVGTYFVTQWGCPTPTTCPDPTSDPPDAPEFAPPGNSFTQSRARFP